MVRGCLEWQRLKLQPPPVVVNATREYEPRATSSQRSWRKPASTGLGCRLQAVVYKHYWDWANRQRIPEDQCLSVTSFGRQLKQKVKGEHTRAGMLYFGIAPKPL